MAERIRLKKGVHRDVTGDCAACHVEHAGVDAELRAAVEFAVSSPEPDVNAFLAEVEEA